MLAKSPVFLSIRSCLLHLFLEKVLKVSKTPFEFVDRFNRVWLGVSFQSITRIKTAILLHCVYITGNTCVNSERWCFRVLDLRMQQTKPKKHDTRNYKIQWVIPYIVVDFTHHLTAFR